MKSKNEKPAAQVAASGSNMLDHYNAVKATLPAGSILLLKLGDFYEVFGEDAATVAKALNITLTKRREIPMAGIPWHALKRSTLDLIRITGREVATADYEPRPLPGSTPAKLNSDICAPCHPSASPESSPHAAGEAAHTPRRFSCAAVTDSGLLIKGPSKAEVLQGVRACNSHAALVAALAELKEYADALAAGTGGPEMNPFKKGSRANLALEGARAALAAAKEGQPTA